MRVSLVIVLILGLVPLNSQGCPMSESANVQKISQILLKPVALVLSDATTAELSDAYIAALTATLLSRDEAETEAEAISMEAEAVADRSEEDVLPPVRLEYVRPMSGGVHVLRLEPPVDLEQVRQLTERLSAREDVEYAEPDQPRRR